jgi:DNA-binding response OmpR family regulator
VFASASGKQTLKQDSADGGQAAIRSILLIDDDPELCSLMEEFFSAHDFRLEAVHDGAKGLARAVDGKYDLVLLDVMLPVLDGFEVLVHLRQRSSVPVILLTARAEPQDRVSGLDAGADDYLAKPFPPQELLARVRAVLRRTSPGHAASDLPVQVGELKLYPHTREVWRGAHRLDLTTFEFSILDVLMRSAGRAVSRDELAAILYQRQSTPFERSIDVHVSHLRKKLEVDQRTLIRTVRGVGYLLVPADEQSK